MFHTLDPHNLDFKQDHLGSHHPQYYANDYPGGGPIDNEDKMNLIDGEGASSAKIVGRDTRNARNQRFNPGTNNGATESPSMDMDLQHMPSGGQ